MKNAGLYIALLMLAASCSTQPDKEKKSDINMETSDEGWESLFDGKTTTGWHNYGKSGVREAWKVIDGNLFLDTTLREKDGQIVKGEDIVSDQEYENFHLKLE